MNKTEILTMARPAFLWGYSVAVGLYVECSQRYFYYGWKGGVAGVGAFVVDRIQESRRPAELPQPDTTPYIGEIVLTSEVAAEPDIVSSEAA